MATIKYQSGIPKLPHKWEGVLSGLLDRIGLPTLTISSTRRTLDSNSQAIYTNAKNLGVQSVMSLYNSSMKQVVQVYADMVKAGRNQADTISAMSRKTATLPLPIHVRPQDDTFCVFDVPPSYIPANMRGAFEKIMRQNASKFISPFVSKGEPVYHIEFGGIKAAKVAETGIAALGLIALAAFFLLRK